MRFAKVYLEITNMCNLSCAFCPGTKRKPEMLSPQNFEALLKKLVGYTRFLYLHVMGEPLLHPALPELLAIAEQYGFRVILTTNGTLLKSTERLLLTSRALHKVNISLHSFEANDRGDFREYVTSCADFATKAGEEGILINLRLWNLDGPESKGLHQRNDEIITVLRQYFPRPWPDVRGGQRLSENVYLAWGERFEWPDSSREAGSEQRYCYGLKDQIGILCDGTVVPCCLDHEGEISLGNLFSDSMQEILDRPRTQAIVEGFRSRRAVELLCRRCGYSTRFL